MSGLVIIVVTLEFKFNSLGYVVTNWWSEVGILDQKCIL